MVVTVQSGQKRLGDTKKAPQLDWCTKGWILTDILIRFSCPQSKNSLKSHCEDWGGALLEMQVVQWVAWDLIGGEAVQKYVKGVFLHKTSELWADAAWRLPSLTRSTFLMILIWEQKLPPHSSGHRNWLFLAREKFTLDTWINEKASLGGVF